MTLCYDDTACKLIFHCLQVLWERCCYGEEQQASCSPYFCDVFTEETLQEHEQELRVLNTHYHTHKELFKLVGKREKLWEEKVAFENPADGCSRFENRGGTLIKELKRYQVRRRIGLCGGGGFRFGGKLKWGIFVSRETVIFFF